MIKRYDPIKGADYSSMSPVGEMKESLYGGYVKYEDHLKANEWISVETPPEEKKWVDVWLKDAGRLPECQFMMGEFWHGIVDLSTMTATHWRNLPAPPTSKEE